MRDRKVNKFLRIVLVVLFLATQFLSAGTVFADAPPEKVTGTVVYSGSTTTYLTATYSALNPIPNAFGVTNTGYNAWCVDKELSISTGTSYDVILYNPADGTWTDDPSIGGPSRWDSIPWKKLTWIVNNDSSISNSVVQNAIWKLTNPTVSINDTAADAFIATIPTTLAECSTYPTQVLVNYQADNKQLLITEYNPEKFPVLYDKNDTAATGSQDDTSDPYQPGVTVTVLDENDMALANHSFDGWNTESNGSGDDLDDADTFRMPGNAVTLYAQWTEDTKYTVTYDGNTSTSGSVDDPDDPYYAGTSVTVMGQGNLLKTNYTFGGWNTQADGLGTTYGSSFAMPANNVIVYAMWDLTPIKSVEITKVADSDSVMVGETITYTIQVTNTGNVPIWGVYADDMLGIETNFKLDVGESTTPVTGTYVTDISDVPQVDNIAVVYLDEEFIHEELDDPDDSAEVTVYVNELPPPPTPTPTPPPPVLVPNISVTITPDATLVEVGTDVNFTMVVTNTGQTVLRDVVVSTPDLGFTTTIPVLYVTGSETFTAPKTMSEVGDFIPTVTATGNSTGTLVTSVSDTDVTAVEVYEIITPPTPTPPPLDPPDNPETGAIPFDAYSVSGLIAMGAGIFALVSRKKEETEADED